MRIRIMRLTFAIGILASTITPQIHALKDYNPHGYVDDLSSLPGLEIYHNNKPSQYSVGSIAKWIDAHQMLCAAGLTVTGFVLLYVINPDVRSKVHAWLGFHAEQQDEIH